MNGFAFPYPASQGFLCFRPHFTETSLSVSLSVTHTHAHWHTHYDTANDTLTLTVTHTRLTHTHTRPAHTGTRMHISCVTLTDTHTDTLTSSYRHPGSKAGEVGVRLPSLNLFVRQLGSNSVHCGPRSTEWVWATVRFQPRVKCLCYAKANVVISKCHDLWKVVVCGHCPVTLSITSYWNIKMALIAAHLNAGAILVVTV